MKIKTKADDLAAAFQLAAAVAPPRSTLSVLGHALIEAAGFVTVCGTDMEKYVKSFVPYEDIMENGGVCLPIKHTAALLSQLGESEITLEVDDATNRVTIKSAGGKYTIAGIKADEFPVIPDLSPNVTVTMKAETLRTMLRRCLFAAAKDESKGIMKGVLFEVGHGNINSKLTLVATDTHRLSMTENTVECAGTDEVALIIDSKSLVPLLRALDDAESVSVGFSDRLVSFQLETTTFLLPVLAGQFPNYRKVIPKPDNAASIRIERKLLHDALRRAKVILGEDGEKVRFDVCSDRHDDDRTVADLHLSTQDDMSGSEGFEGLPIQFDGSFATDTRFACKCDYWLDYLNVAEAEEIVIHTGGELQPLLVRELRDGDVDGSYIHVIMPVSY